MLAGAISAIGFPVKVCPLGIPKVYIEEIELELPSGYECFDEEPD